ncbi:hypothetical protein, conserved [Babesia bigemina]|uniref:ERCC4 domain-containing protein n=1 Tax=Babesia bigemina TaxID=5866 RepID=A0A061D9K1_BABBI|nr:hypothetical protein, conserved [Babesia bigemina]CDR94400.1 hypothetical protein, conserved [Babesia bigemina]|eukprot:XP_012766586.1 hypothetical protein, conserved [Babesia bigemina]
MSQSCTSATRYGDDSETWRARMSLWLPPPWYHVLPHLEKFREASNMHIDLYTDNKDEVLGGEIYHLMCREGNICTLCTNFTYRTHLSRARDAAARDAMANGDETAGSQSPGSSVGARLSDFNADESSDEEPATQQLANRPAVVFLIFTKEDIVKLSVEMLRQRITTTIELFQVLYPNVKILVVMHAVRLYALHGQNSPTDSQSPQRDSQTPVMHNLTLDDIICSLMIEYQVDVVEAEDDVELAKFIVDAASAAELCATRRGASGFRAKPQSNLSQDTSLATNTWITQLQQIPELGQEAATAIAEMYSTPVEVMEAIEDSPDKLVESLSNLSSGTRGSRKLATAIANRIATLFSQNVEPNTFVMDNCDS